MDLFYGAESYTMEFLNSPGNIDCNSVGVSDLKGQQKQKSRLWG